MGDAWKTIGGTNVWGYLTIDAQQGDLGLLWRDTVAALEEDPETPLAATLVTARPLFRTRNFRKEAFPDPRPRQSRPIRGRLPKFRNLGAGNR